MALPDSETLEWLVADPEFTAARVSVGGPVDTAVLTALKTKVNLNSRLIGKHDMKKLSIIRFKPKPENFQEFLQNLRQNSSQGRTAIPPTHYLMTHGDEIYAVAIRDADALQESSAEGVNWLDTQRHLLQEYNEVDRHTLPVTGDLVED